jgi:hypothetical protein
MSPSSPLPTLPTTFQPLCHQVCQPLCQPLPTRYQLGVLQPPIPPKGQKPRVRRHGQRQPHAFRPATLALRRVETL